MTPRERAEKIVKSWYDIAARHKGSIMSWCCGDGHPSLVAEIAAAIEAERERAAKVADNWTKQFGAISIQHVPAQKYATDAVADIAAAIRAGEP